MNIALGSDHHGFAHKAFIKEHHQIAGSTIHWNDMGCTTPDDCDYPEFAHYVVHAILSGQADRGVLLCGTGAGIAMAANRFNHIYAALAWNEETARLAREHDNANILVIPADYVTAEQAVKMIEAWLGAKFLGGRHEHRLMMIDEVVHQMGDGE